LKYAEIILSKEQIDTVDVANLPGMQLDHLARKNGTK